MFSCGNDKTSARRLLLYSCNAINVIFSLRNQEEMHRILAKCYYIVGCFPHVINHGMSKKAFKCVAYYYLHVVVIKLHLYLNP